MQVVLAVADLERSLAFYEAAFAWPRNPRIDYANYVELHPDDGGTLGLYERGGFAGTVGVEPLSIDNGKVAPSYVYVRVEDVEDAVRRLTDAGGRPLSALTARQWGETAAWFADPDGNVIAVAGPTPD
jgi:predicted enzyme related to lactoylglutathione lyase